MRGGTIGSNRVVGHGSGKRIADKPTIYRAAFTDVGIWPEDVPLFRCAGRLALAWRRRLYE
jgi:hypothetical protein